MATFFPHLYEYSQLVKSMETKSNKKRAKVPKKNIIKEKFFERQQKIQSILQIPPSTSTFTQFYQSNDIKYLLFIEEKLQKLRESYYNPMELYNVKIEKVLEKRTELSNIEKYHKPKEWPFENQMKFPESGKHWMVCDMILCIEMAKTLPFFEKLDVKDQLEVIKTTTIFNTLLTSTYYSSASNSDVIIYPDGHLPVKYPIIHKTHFDIYERIVEPLKRIKMTKEEYVLLKIIILCSTKSETISHKGREILENELNNYNNLLLKYLQAKHGNGPGAVRFSQILLIMEAIIHFAQKSREFYIWYRISNWLGLPPLLMDEIIY